MDSLGNLDPTVLSRGYRLGDFTPLEIVTAAIQRIEADKDFDAVWIYRLPRTEVLARAEKLTELLGTNKNVVDALPLFGLPFAVKDNIDVAGKPTTAACPEFTYIAQHTATVVEKLLAAGAILIGKTNMDQFATGLVGTRSPYGIPPNPFNADYVPGGSSSGSAVAVAKGWVSFALGTDTAGSGRVPAALNNIVGLKPTRGLLSTRGVVPACRSLDCVSVFAGSVSAAMSVANVLVGFDAKDPFSRRTAASQRFELLQAPKRVRVAVPRADRLEFFGDEAGAQEFRAALATVAALGGEITEIDFGPFRQAADLLYRGPWLAERQLVARNLLEKNAQSVHPDVRAPMLRGQNYSASDMFEAYHTLKALRRQVEVELANVDCLLAPTFGRAYRVAEVLANPQETNSNLGYYTNFVNLLDLCAIAVPSGFLPSGVPFGVTLMGPAYSENRLAAFADNIHRARVARIGATEHALPSSIKAKPAAADFIPVCVVGAHMSGLPLNCELLDVGAHLLKQTETAAHYRLFALEHMNPIRPGMIRVQDGAATRLSVEVWAVPSAQFGAFHARVRAPLAIGPVELADGAWVAGFVCQDYALRSARDISAWGGWRAYLANPKSP